MNKPYCGSSGEQKHINSEAASVSDSLINDPSSLPGTTYNPYISVKTGETLQFGGYNWRVLEIKDGKALIISNNIIARHEYGPVSAWEKSEIRRYLNGQFFEAAFSANEKALIAESIIPNKADPIYGLAAGEDTADKLFLLSVEEAVKYFGDSGRLALGPKYINDEYNAARVAKDNDTGAALWWFLRSPGDVDNLAVCVGDDGGVYVTGHGITTSKAGAGGVRPALWLRLGRAV